MISFLPCKFIMKYSKSPTGHAECATQICHFHVNLLLIYFLHELWQGYQGISCPSQAKNLPLSWILTLLMMLSSFWTENSLVKSLSGGTFLWNGLERSVSTVPGCSKMHTTGSFLLANSREAVFDTVRISRKKIANSLYNFKNHLIYTWPMHNMYLLKLSLNTFFVPTI